MKLEIKVLICYRDKYMAWFCFDIFLVSHSVDIIFGLELMPFILQWYKAVMWYYYL